MDTNSFNFNNDIIIVGQQPWDTDIGSNCKNISIELSKTNRVLYINSPLDRATIFRNKTDHKIKKRLRIIKKEEQGLIKIKDNLWTYYPDCIVESINWINQERIFNIINKYNNRKLAASIQKAISNLSFKNIILFNDNEMFKGFYLQEFLKPELSIYYSRDFMIAVDYWKKHGRKIEPLLIGKSDLCISNSEYLANYCRRYNPRSFNVGQGCDMDSFINVDQKMTDELKDLQQPIIGYVGALNSARLNIGIIEAIATKYPHYSIVLIGPEDADFLNSDLHQMNNVFFLGQKSVDSLPHYIKSFSVCINPQYVNEITIGNYPRKIDEYLAMGKPVIATHTETMEVFEDFVYLAEDINDYVKLIDRAIQEDNKQLQQARIDFAFTHTWEISVDLMKRKIVDALSLKAGIGNTYSNQI